MRPSKFEASHLRRDGAVDDARMMGVDGFWAALAVDQTSQRVQGVLNIGMTTENSGSTRSWATRGLHRPGSTFLT